MNQHCSEFPFATKESATNAKTGAKLEPRPGAPALIGLILVIVIANKYMIVLSRAGEFVPLAILAALCVISYSTILGGYFYADDLPYLRFLASYSRPGANIFHEIFFTRCAEFQPFLYCYRPLPDLYLLAIYSIAGANPIWYHIANISLHIGCTWLMFIIAKKLLAPHANSKLIAFMAAATFATCPVYGEVIYGTMNCVTGLCGLFFLLAYKLFLDWQNERKPEQLALSVAAFACALLCKELAMLLPFMIAATIALRRIWPQNGFSSSSTNSAPATTPISRRQALLAAGTYSTVLLTYIIIRSTVLGPTIGGYVGALGNLNLEQSANRLFSAWPLIALFPLHNEVSSDWAPVKLMLAGAYVVLFALLIINRKQLFMQSDNRFVIAIATAWMLLTAIPTIPVFSIEPGLGGGRQLYLTLTPLFIAMAATTFSARLKPLWCAAWSTIIAMFCIINVQNNNMYTQSSLLVKSLGAAVQQKLSEIPPDKTLLVLNPPWQWKGLYLFPTSDMFYSMFELSDAGKSLSQRLALPSCWSNANYNLYGKARLKRLLERSDIFAVSWDNDKRNLIDQSVKTSSVSADGATTDGGVAAVPGGSVVVVPGGGVVAASGGVVSAPGGGVVSAPGGGVVAAPGDGVVSATGGGVVSVPGGGVVSVPGGGVVAVPGGGVVSVPRDKTGAMRAGVKLTLGDGSIDVNLHPTFVERNQFGQVAVNRFFVDPKLLRGGTDFIEAEYSCARTSKATNREASISFWWQTVENPIFASPRHRYQAVVTDGRTRKLLIPISPTINDLIEKYNGAFEIRMPSPNYLNELKNVRLVGWRHIAPVIAINSGINSGTSSSDQSSRTEFKNRDGRFENRDGVSENRNGVRENRDGVRENRGGVRENRDGVSENRDGVYEIGRNGCRISFDASSVESAAKVIVEISQQDALLERGLAYPFRTSDSRDYAKKRFEFGKLKGELTIPASLLQPAGVYEIEAGTLDANGTMQNFSEPIYVRSSR